MDVYDIGESVRSKRREMGFTQEQLAHKVGLSRHTIMKLESGQISDLGIRKIIAILDVLVLQLSVGAMKTDRPTYEEVMERNALEEAELRQRITGRKSRV